MRRLKKNYYLAIFCSTVAVLGLMRWASNDHSVPSDTENVGNTESRDTATGEAETSHNRQDFILTLTAPGKTVPSTSQSKRPHPIYSVPSYAGCFPDLQDIQIMSARKHGIRPVENRKEAEKNKDQLVYIGSNPYYKIDPAMSHSIPYLVPHAAMVLETIARNYIDSLHIKGIPLHKILVSSVLRTNEGVRRLMRINPNASPESCHRYGTTFDIAYNRYHTIMPPDEHRRTVQSDTLKWVLAEVLRDLREEGQCYIKYEVKQGCFHITAR